MMTKLLQKIPLQTVCPQCGQEINDVWICEMKSVIGMRYAYLCSNCEKLLGISTDKNGLLPIPSKDSGIKTHLQNNNYS
ncbi:MAG: hypothetical protein WBN42_07005 [Ignavibacteriaceae bacterium]